ncbi:MAG TPA: phage tail tape measure C-terminal domain-containing protein, partial [Acidimicrobiia bacterium]
IGWLGDFVGDWGDTFEGIGNLIRTAINVWIGLHVGFVQAAGQVITTGIPAAFNLAMGAAKNAVIAGLQFILNAVVSALGGVGDALSYIPGVADDLGSQIRTALNVDLSGLRADTEALTEDFRAAGSAITTTFGEAINRDYVGILGDGVATLGDNLQTRLVERLNVANEELTDAAANSTEVAEVVAGSVVPALDNLGGSAGRAAGAMSDLNKEREQFIEGITEEFARIQEANGGAVAAVELWYQQQRAQLQALGLEYTQYADMLDVIFNERIAEAYQTDLENATDWRSGIERAVQGLGESIGSEADLAESALTSLFDNAANAIVEFAKTGKFDFKEFARSVAADILMLTTRMLLFKALSSFLPGLSGGGMAGFAEGGFVNFATGGSVRGPGTGTSDSIPAMLSNGEFVVNAAATKDFLPLLEAINSGNMDMMGLAMGGLSNEGASLPAQPAAASQAAPEQQGGSNQGGGGANLTIIPTINPRDIVDTFDSDDGDRVLINMLERNKTTIRGVLG